MKRLAIFISLHLFLFLLVIAYQAQAQVEEEEWSIDRYCLLYTSPSPRDATLSRMPSSA